MKLIKLLYNTASKIIFHYFLNTHKLYECIKLHIIENFSQMIKHNLYYSPLNTHNRTRIIIHLILNYPISTYLNDFKSLGIF